MELPTINSEEQSFLAEEFKQAWEHYRHLENARTKLIAFAVTFFLSALTFDGLMFRIGGHVGADVYPMILVANLVVLTFVLYIRQSVAAIKPILRHYEDVIWKIRAVAFKDGGSVHAYLGVRSNPTVKERGPLLSVQALTEVMLFSMIAIMAIVSIVMVYALISGQGIQAAAALQSPQ